MNGGMKVENEIEVPEKIASPEMLKKRFDEDTAKVAEQTMLFVRTMHPAYLVNSKEQVCELSYPKSDTILDAFTFYRLVSCTTENIDDLYSFLNEKMTKFFSAIYSFEKPVIYGVVSYQGFTNLVVGLYDKTDGIKTIRSVIEGLLDGIELCPYKPLFSKRCHSEKNVGFISAVPAIKISGERQKFDISLLMKSLNGQDYTVFFIARPISQDETSNRYGEIIKIRDACFAVSKRNISRQQGTSHSVGETKGNAVTDTHSEGVTRTWGATSGLSFILNMGSSWGLSKTVMDSHSVSENFSKSISDTINQNEGISAEIQNGFALEMMEYADKAIERLRQGRSNGMWETVISYSADTAATAGIIQACITGEMAKPNPDILPLISKKYQFTKKESMNNSIILPKIIMGEQQSSPLCTALTSEELGMICAIPTESVPDFELKKGKVYPIVSERTGEIELGFLTEGNRQIMHMPFNLSHKDLARHTFICGITGSGKTTAVKRILRDAMVPFLVIESAKKEYRNIKLSDGRHPIVYTLGKPEINCLRFNPFYIQCGVSPQTHIDFLKDLFSASFSFYGPMPYILEKCLHTIYEKRGWNLTLGFHPYLVNRKNSVDLFEAEYMQNNYKKYAHKFLFPTMQDLKCEIKRYIDEEMQYEGEVAGNIKTAILARLESLCSGTKGYMFNTYEFADMDALLNEYIVFELEGLADDADKAFCVGLFIIFINEYRQIIKETSVSQQSLSHLLVIEEAHRLLKNVDTERSTEEMGNPKGKAVEHFTNMIAEMRSYGQGVIIAEQIPTKLAPDVIKNSSNKIIQRLVAADDQKIIANTIGLNDNNAIYIGNLTIGRALCHKEGMSLPVNVTIHPIEEIVVMDSMLYREDVVGRLHRINKSIIKECILDDIDFQALKVFNSILIQDYTLVKKSIIKFQDNVRLNLIKKNVELILCEDENAIYSELLSETIVRYLLNGVYSTKTMISNALFDAFVGLFYSPSMSNLKNIRIELKKAYRDDPKYKGEYIISQLVYSQMDANTDVSGTIKNYFMVPDKASIKKIILMIKER